MPKWVHDATTYLLYFLNEKRNNPGKDDIFHTGYSNFKVDQKKVAEEDEKENVGNLKKR